MVLVGLVLVAIPVFFIFKTIFPSADTKQRDAAKYAARAAARERETYSVATGGTGKCPKCGGVSWQVCKKTSTKVAFGAASLLADGQHVACVTCGLRLRRG